MCVVCCVLCVCVCVCVCVSVCECEWMDGWMNGMQCIQVHEVEVPATIKDGGKTEFTSLCYSTESRLFVGSNSGIVMLYVMSCVIPTLRPCHTMGH